jgi:ribose transport system substrate-binding protein
VRAHVRGLDAERGRLDAVFCTNDEMALGAVEALRALDSAATRNTVIIGVDGVPEARALIDSGTSPLRATVVQDSHRFAASAIHLLTRMRRGRSAPKRTVPRPEIHQASPDSRIATSYPRGDSGGPSQV